MSHAEAMSVPSSPGCILCAVVAGTVPASRVYEDDETVAVLSLDQPTPYKTLVLPRAHLETVYDLDDDQAGRLFAAVAHVARAVRAASGCAGLNLVQSNGAAAGQELAHFHMHLVPRAEGDDIRLSWPDRRADRDALDAMAADIVRNMKAG